MKFHRLISYSLITAGAIVSTKAVLSRWRWEENNVFAAIMLDWDDVQAVATRALVSSAESNAAPLNIAALLCRFKENGATHLSLPELTLKRLIDRGELSVTQGPDSGKVYLRAQTPAIAQLVTTELQARLPQTGAKSTQANNPLISFSGDLPTVAEVGLGFDPAHAALAREVGLAPVARPIGYSWVQPEMIQRTLDQAAELGAKIVAVQGNLIPGHEFRIQATVDTMRRNRLTYAYFSESRHQKGDWFLAKELAGDGLTIMAHEFEPPELLDDDWHTISYRWANLAVEGGIRLCSVRFFRILHAADPLESMAYVEALSSALFEAGLLTAHHAGAVDLTIYQPDRDPVALAGAGLSAAGAAGLAADLLPVSDEARLLGLGVATIALSALPFLENKLAARGHHHHHDHDHGLDDHDHHHDHDHSHNHDHHHHDHHHRHDHGSATAYAPKGIALASAIAFPAAAAAIDGADPLTALAQSLALGAAGVAALATTTAETDYLFGVEAYRGYDLDWLVPLGLAAGHALLKRPPRRRWSRKQNRSLWGWLPAAGVTLAALKSFSGGFPADLPAAIDREHRHAHTHHLSAFQRMLGDSKMALSPKPLRKWAMLAPLGAVGAALFKQRGQDELAAAVLTVAAAGQVASLTGFRNSQRPLIHTLKGRAKGWAVGLGLATIVWFIAWLLGRKR